MDKYRIDSHKLIYHPGRVAAWMKGETVYPIYMEISPAGACNHRCTYCGLDFMNYEPRFLKTDRLREIIPELGRLGLKSMMYAGEGEPLLHKDIADLIALTKKSGIDPAITTNGVLLSEKLAPGLIRDCSWIKVSINGATPQTYTKIHRCQPTDFERVIENMKRAVEIRRVKGYKCTLGFQLLLLPENRSEAPLLAQIARDIGLDYLVIKPYSQHPQSITREYETVSYGDIESVREQLLSYNTDTFSAIVRIHTMKKWDTASKNYRRCLALPFWSYIDAGGNVWGCSVYLNDKRFLYGNIYEQSFKEIWQGEARRKSLAWCNDSLDPAQCRVNCRMDEINRYLWDLKNAPEHVNFI